MNTMESIVRLPLSEDQAGLWWLGQAGYAIRSGDITLAIDPYLSDSVGGKAPDFSRQYPPPLTPQELKVDIMVVTHDHLDHLDPETIGPYSHKQATTFVAPHLAAAALQSHGVAPDNIVRIDSGESKEVRGVEIRGVYALASEPNVADTTGYRITFANGRSVYHSSDTGLNDLLLESIPPVEVALVCINGKWGNLTAEQAVELCARIKPRFAVPNHYDVMALNSENPKTFSYFMRDAGLGETVRIVEVMNPFVWGTAEG